MAGVDCDQLYELSSSALYGTMNVSGEREKVGGSCLDWGEAGRKQLLVMTVAQLLTNVTLSYVLI